MNNIGYKCHILVCVNDRNGERQSCADEKSKDIHKVIKKKIKAKNWLKEDVRVSQTLCLGLCSSGPNVLIYPQNIHYSRVSLDDVQVIIDKLSDILK